MGNRWLAAAGLAAVTMIAAACGSASSGNSGNSGSTAGSGGGSASSPASAGTTGAGGSTTIDARHVGGKLVLTNSKGFTLYWFAPDTATASKCDASCIKYWPPVKGPVTAGHGVTGKLGTITRSDGSTQATYNGHPLYTYIGDTGPGQAKGNGLNIEGGLWYEVTVSGMAPHKKSSGGGSSGGGGGGYSY
jgi:predicted lipoprotein with Yx(FWY)xxD motif